MKDEKINIPVFITGTVTIQLTIEVPEWALSGLGVSLSGEKKAEPEKQHTPTASPPPEDLAEFPDSPRHYKGSPLCARCKKLVSHHKDVRILSGKIICRRCKTELESSGATLCETVSCKALIPENKKHCDECNPPSPPAIEVEAEVEADPPLQACCSAYGCGNSVPVSEIRRVKGVRHCPECVDKAIAIGAVKPTPGFPEPSENNAAPEPLPSDKHPDDMNKDELKTAGLPFKDIRCMVHPGSEPGKGMLVSRQGSRERTRGDGGGRICKSCLDSLQNNNDQVAGRDPVIEPNTTAQTALSQDNGPPQGYNPPPPPEEPAPSESPLPPPEPPTETETKVSEIGGYMEGNEIVQCGLCFKKVIYDSTRSWGTMSLCPVCYEKVAGQEQAFGEQPGPPESQSPESPESVPQEKAWPAKAGGYDGTCNGCGQVKEVVDLCLTGIPPEKYQGYCEVCTVDLSMACTGCGLNLHEIKQVVTPSGGVVHIVSVGTGFRCNCCSPELFEL